VFVWLQDLRLLAHGPEHVTANDIIAILKFDGQQQRVQRVRGHLEAVLRAMAEEDLCKFLVFVTEFGHIPEGGLRNDNQIGGQGKIKVTVVADATGAHNHRRPEAHTCFYELVLPDYESVQLMRSMLTESFDSTDGVGFQMA